MKFQYSWIAVFFLLLGEGLTVAVPKTCKKKSAQKTVSVSENPVDATANAKAAKYAMNLNGVEWDASCALANPQNKKETRQDAVMVAWAGALELVSDAWDRFNGLTYPKLTDGSSSLTEAIIYTNDTA